MITMDKDGNVWEAMMGQTQFAKLDPKTGKVSVYLAPDWKKGDTRSTMIDALHSDVDGNMCPCIVDLEFVLSAVCACRTG
jgi:hypothetical protein